MPHYPVLHHWLRVPACLALLAAASTLPAAITFDADSTGTGIAVSSVTWSHPLGEGPNRAVVVGVAVENANNANLVVTSVTFNGAPLTFAPGSKIAGGASANRNQSELWYATEGSLPAGGASYDVVVTLAGPVDGVIGGALSFLGVAPVAPEAATSSALTSGVDDISTSLTTLTNGAWIVDILCAGNPGNAENPFTANINQQDRLQRKAGAVLSAAMSTRFVPAAGSAAMAWSHENTNRFAHSLLALKPADEGPPPVFHALTTIIDGSGTIQRSPNEVSYFADTEVTLTAVPTLGWGFTGWSGDASGTTNPTTVTMAEPRSVTAHFEWIGGVPDVTLNVEIFGQGSVTRDPDQASYQPGTQITLTAIPAEDWSFAGWSGALSGTDNPTVIDLDANRSVTALFIKQGARPDFGLMGWATAGTGTTGGAGGPTVTVSTLEGFLAAVNTDGPLIILVSGVIAGTGDSVRVKSNKSILGLGADAGFINLGLQVGWNSSFGQIGNVIIRNLTFDRVRSPTDKIMVAYGARNVWIDHCVFISDRLSGGDYYDGQLDITHGANYVTVSWCRFVDHFKNSLVGHSENNGSVDSGNLTVTYHHNWFLRTNSRNPSVRFGLVHVFNNYYLDVSLYGIASRQNAELVVENNYFQNVPQPMNADTGLSDIPGRIRGVASNIFVNCGANSIITPEATWVPPYTYALDAAADVPALVSTWSGVGIIDVTEPPPIAYDAWEALAALPADQRDALDDPDGDGVPNLLEFVLARDPSQHDATAVLTVTTAGPDDAFPAITFLRRRSLSGVIVEVEAATGPDFVSMLSTIEVSTVTVDDTTERVTVRSTVPLTDSASQFFRVRAAL